MNRILVIVIVAVFTLAACKSTKQAAQSPYTTDPSAQPKVFSVPVSDTQTIDRETTKIADEKPIAMRSEQISFTQQEDRTKNETNNYFVIIGSFSQLENAKNYRETLLTEGFTPIILHSETGYYRVCVNSFKNEQEARGRISQVRQAFPKYADIWLLVKE